MQLQSRQFYSSSELSGSFLVSSETDRSNLVWSRLEANNLGDAKARVVAILKV